MTEKTYFNTLIVGGFMMRMELERKTTVSLEKTLQSLKNLTDRILVWVKCPKCGWDVPAIDMTTKGYCYYCVAREEGRLDSGKYEKSELVMGKRPSLDCSVQKEGDKK